MEALAGLAVVGAAVDMKSPKAGATSAAAEVAPMTEYQRKAKADGWESFKCSCGKPIQLSPNFSAKRVKCPSCGNKIDIV